MTALSNTKRPLDPIDITMTCTLRPKVLKTTLKSFCDHMFIKRDRFRLIMNIDPIGEPRRPMDMVDAAKLYFDNVVYNIAKTPSFPRAVIWTWSQVSAPWVFHLEDDWTINKRVILEHMLDILRKHKDLACLRLYKHNIPNTPKPRMFDCYYTYYKEGFFIAEDSKKQFGLNPVLIRSTFVKDAVPQMVDTKNPEKQFRYGNSIMRDFVMKWKYGIYGNPGEEACVNDIGSHWIRNQSFTKPKGGAQFLTWAKKGEEK